MTRGDDIATRTINPTVDVLTESLSHGYALLGETQVDLEGIEFPEGFLRTYAYDPAAPLFVTILVEDTLPLPPGRP